MRRKAQCPHSAAAAPPTRRPPRLAADCACDDVFASNRALQSAPGTYYTQPCVLPMPSGTFAKCASFYDTGRCASAGIVLCAPLHAWACERSRRLDMQQAPGSAALGGQSAMPCHPFLPRPRRRHAVACAGQPARACYAELWDGSQPLYVLDHICSSVTSAVGPTDSPACTTREREGAAAGITTAQPTQPGTARTPWDA